MPDPRAEHPVHSLRALAWRHAPLLIAGSLLNGVAVLAHTRLASSLGIAGWFGSLLWLGANVLLLLTWSVVHVARAQPPVDLSPAQRRRFRLRKRLRLALLILLPLGGLLLGELYLRGSQRYATWVEKNGKGYVSPYDDSGAQEVLALAPSTTTTMDQPEFHYEVRTNAEGLWDDAHPVEKPPREYRIVALGDSFTMGQGAAFEDTWLQVLERSLAKVPRPSKVRVISGGVAGSDPVYSLRLLERRLLKYQPDLVLQVVNGTDLGDIVARGGFERFLDSGGVAFRDPPAMELLFGPSHLARAVLMTQFGYDFYVLRPDERAARNQESVEVILEAAQRLTALGSEHGFEVIYVVHPLRHQVFPTPDTVDPLWELDLLGRLAKQGVPCYDLRPFLQQRIPPLQVDDYFWPLDGHCNARGYALFAEGVGQRLTEVPGFPRPREGRER